MKASEKRQLVKELCNAVRDNIVKEIAKMPEDWDGMELREYIADMFERERYMRNPYRKREFAARIRKYERTKHF